MRQGPLNCDEGASEGGEDLVANVCEFMLLRSIQWMERSQCH